MRLAAARIINSIVFYSLLGVIVLVAIPYGTVEPWWKAVFQCLVFGLAVLAVIEKWLRGEKGRHDSLASHPGDTRKGTALHWPVLALIAFALSQTIPWSTSSPDGTTIIPRTLSADPFQTRLFAIQLGALLLFGWMLVRYAVGQKRLHLLVDVIVASGVLSAGFGLWRQAGQHQVGFFLPHLSPGFGYAQFINSNHFAFLMEMVLGLTLGLVVCRGVSGRRLAIYLICAVPLWVALVFANSRGGILSILCQVVFLAGLFVSRREHERRAPSGRVRRISHTRTIVLRAVLVAMLLAGAVVTVVFVGGDPLVGRIDSISIELDRKTADSYTLRQNIWRATWKLIRAHPVTGVGFGGYWIAITKYHEASGETTPQEAHNDYLELLASGGLIGVLLGVWFLVEFVRSARRAVRQVGPFQRAAAWGAIAGILAVAIHSLVDFGLHVTINALVVTVLIAMVSLKEAAVSK